MAEPDGRPAAGPLAIALHSDDFARAHYALVLASTAAALARPVCLFLAGPAIRLAVDPAAWRHWPGAAQDAGYQARGIAGFDELWQICGELGIRRLACEMALRAADLDPAALLPGIERASAVSFLDQPPHASLLFI